MNFVNLRDILLHGFSQKFQQLPTLRVRYMDMFTDMFMDKKKISQIYGVSP